MANVTIKIKGVSWRDGRPRYNPGPEDRKLGFKGEDLRRADGAWMDAHEAAAWMTAQEKALAARRADPRGRKPRAPANLTAAQKAVLLPVGELIRQWFDSPALRGESEAIGRRKAKPLAAATRRSYQQKADVLAQSDPLIWSAPVSVLTQPDLFRLYETLWETRGLSTARGVLATLSAAISWGMRRGLVKLAVNPCLRLGMETPDPTPTPRTMDEIAALIAAADAIGRPEIGDSFALGVWTGQRQTDRLAMIDGGVLDGRRMLTQSKTGVVVAIPDAPILAARLATMRERRRSWPIVPREIVADETPGERRAFKADHYRHVVATVRAAAVAGVKDEAGGWIVKPTPTLATFADKQLRATAVTWLARAGCSIPEICAITGHSPESATKILRHYLSLHPELADNAIRKMVAWHGGKA